jgi:hypothetical protein
MSFTYKLIDETQMPIAPEHAFKEKSTKFLILPSLRTIYKRTFQSETPCRTIYSNSERSEEFLVTEPNIFKMLFSIKNQKIYDIAGQKNPCFT